MSREAAQKSEAWRERDPAVLSRAAALPAWKLAPDKKHGVSSRIWLVAASESVIASTTPLVQEFQRCRLVPDPHLVLHVLMYKVAALRSSSVHSGPHLSAFSLMRFHNTQRQSLLTVTAIICQHLLVYQLCKTESLGRLQKFDLCRQHGLWEIHFCSVQMLLYSILCQRL